MNLLLTKKYIQAKTIPSNSILVLDRTYCSYDFINYLMTANNKFIIRFRNNCKKFNLIKENQKTRILKYRPTAQIRNFFIFFNNLFLYF